MSFWKIGGARRDRTDDLLLAKQALSQLSYGPEICDDTVRTAFSRATDMAVLSVNVLLRSTFFFWNPLVFYSDAYIYSSIGAGNKSNSIIRGHNDAVTNRSKFLKVRGQHMFLKPDSDKGVMVKL